MKKSCGDFILRRINPLRLCYIGSLSNVHTRRWAGFFAQQGHEVHIIATMPRQDSEPSDIKVYSLATHRTGNHLLDLFLAALSLSSRVAELRRLFRVIAPDIVHVHYVNEAALFSVVAGLRPLVLTAWGSDIVISPEKSWIRRQAVKYTLKRADLITCDADHVKRRIVHFGVNPEKVKVIFFGTDVARFQPGQRDRALRKRWAPAGGPVVISIRSLEPIYDLESFVRAIPPVRARFPEATFLIGGSGSLAGALRELAVKLGVEQNVRFLGVLSQEELPTYLASSDVYVSTALSDGGIAASTAEAMASGLPVVITDVGDNRQWVEDAVNGFLVPLRDPQTLAERVMRLLEARDLRACMGSAGRQVIVNRNNWHKEMLRMEELYQALAGGSS